MRAPLAPPRLSLPRKVEADAQAVVDQLRDGEFGCQDFGLQSGDILRPDQLVIDRGNRILPDQRLLGNQRPEIARDGAHVAVRQLEPGLGEGVREAPWDGRGSGGRSSRRSGPCAATGPS